MANTNSELKSRADVNIASSSSDSKDSMDTSGDRDEQLAEAKLLSERIAQHTEQHQHQTNRKYTFAKRKHPEAKATKKEKRLLNKDKIGLTLHRTACCPARCTDSITVNDVYPLRELYASASTEKQRTALLLNQLVTNAHSNKHTRKIAVSILGRERPVCLETFRRAFGPGRDKLREAVRRWRSGQTQPAPHASTCADHPSPQSDFVYAELANFFNGVCDDVPSATGVRRVMSFYQSWTALHKTVARHFEQTHAASPLKQKPPSFATFERVRKQYFGNVQRPRKGQQPRCTVCVAINNERARCDAEQRPELNRQMQAHAEFNRKERHADQAEIDAVLAAGGLVIDWDYTSSAELPHFFFTPKVRVSLLFVVFGRFLFGSVSFRLLCLCLQALSKKVLLKVRIAGAYVQGSTKGSGLHLVLHTDHVRKDGNAVATALFEIIRAVRDPSHKQLLITHDNASGEAKNTTLLALWTMLVLEGWFSTITMMCTAPGHGHRYLDALFSHLQRALHQRTLTSFADVIDALQHAFTAERLQPHITVLLRAYSFSSFFEPKLNKFAGHSVPLWFQFQRLPGLTNTAGMMARDTSAGQWYGWDRGKVPIGILQGMPRGYPQLLAAAEPSDYKAIEETLQTAERHKLVPATDIDHMRKLLLHGPDLAISPAAVGDGGVGSPAVVTRPGSSDMRFSVRVIHEAPKCMQPPPPSRCVAAAVHKPPVPLFVQPRVGVITKRKDKLKELREKAEAEEKAKSASPATAAPTSASADSKTQSKAVPGPPVRAPFPTAAPDARTSSAHTRASPRLQQQQQKGTNSASVFGSQIGGVFVPWSSVDDEMDLDD